MQFIQVFLIIFGTNIGYVSDTSLTGKSLQQEETLTAKYEVTYCDFAV
jgi:hypothetical protein